MCGIFPSKEKIPYNDDIFKLMQEQHHFDAEYASIEFEIRLVVVVVYGGFYRMVWYRFCPKAQTAPLCPNAFTRKVSIVAIGYSRSRTSPAIYYCPLTRLKMGEVYI